MLKAISLTILAVTLATTTHAQVVVKDDQVQVTVDEILAQLKTKPGHIQQRLARDPSRLSQIARNAYLEKRLEREAKERGYVEEPLVQQMMENAARQALAQYALRRLVQDSLPEDFDTLAREHYLVNQEQYQRPAQVRASHILLTAEERTEQEAEELAQELYARLQDDPDVFPELVEAHSDDPTAGDNLGSLGWFSAEEMVTPFSEAAFSLTPGSISEPVKTRFGWHLIRVHERREAEVLPYEAVKARIVQQLESERYNTLRSDVMAVYSTSESLETFPDELEGLADKLEADDTE